MRKHFESRRNSGANNWIEPLENRTLMAAHGALESVAPKATPSSAPTVTKLVTGLASGSGSTVGPNGDLFITEGKTGRVLEVNPRTGRVSTFAEGLPPWLLGLGGAMDVEFVGGKAYVLVTMVGSDLGGDSTVGVYRVDGPHSFTVVADIGAWSVANPPEPAFFIPTGVQYSMESYHGDLVVADGHHNRVLLVTLDGDITEIMTFPNIVPTGLAIKGNTVYLSQAGPIPHLPENGKVVSFRIGDDTSTLVASGAPLLDDVEFGRGNTMYALAQGPHTNPQEGSPSDPNGGSLVRANRDGTFTTVVDKLNQPTSMEIVGDTAYVVMLSGEVWRVDNLPGPGRGGQDDGESHAPASPFSDREMDRRGSFFDDRERDNAGNRQLLLASGPR
jgi:sugar lactone lactonase YvrE